MKQRQPYLALYSFAALAALAAPAGASAQAVDVGGPQNYSLTPGEKAALLDNATETSAEAARAGRPAQDGNAIHGEVGAMIGTGGTRGAYGVAAIPLGDRAGAIVSFESSRIGSRRRR